MRRAIIHGFIVVFAGVALAACGEKDVEQNSNDAVAGRRLDQTDLQSRLDDLQAQRPDVPGFSVSVRTFDGARVSAATGVAGPDDAAMTAPTPLRIASNTKTIVAAAILRLVEQQRLDLDAPIAGLISAAHNTLLVGDGYKTGDITVRHLLMHAGGLDDHFAGDAFKSDVLANPSREWTRTDQLAILVETTEPVAPPGERFHYSDSGYLLLGEVIERITNAPLGEAVRSLTRLDEIGLEKTWWEGEPPPPASPARAQQRLGGVNAALIHGSVDAYGGGGLIASTDDLARFLTALFTGAVFDAPETLTLMLTAPGRPEASPYRLGLFTQEYGGRTLYGHGGFWGTDALVAPELGVVIAGATLAQSGVDDLHALHLDVLQSIAAQ